MIKILHLADLHLDSPFASLAVTQRDERRRELREALERVCDICKKEKTDIMLVAGDLFESDYVRAETVHFTAELFRSIPDTRIFISPGNHDPYGARSPYRAASFSDNVHIFTEEKMTCVDIPHLNTSVYGYGFCSKSVGTNPFDNFKVRDTSRINLLCAHGDLDTPSSVYCNIPSDALSASLTDYAALGHIHNPDGFRKFGKTVCAYSGCPVPRGFDECGEKGVICGELSLGNVSVRYVPLTERRYENVEILLETDANAQSIKAEILEKCGGFDNNTCLRITFSGTVHEQIPFSEQELRKILPKPFYLEVCDNTAEIPDISKLLTEQSLRGEFCRKLAPYLSAEDMTERKKAALALKYGISALHG